MRAMRATESASDGMLPRLAQQLDIDGRLHDLPPEIESMRLFDHRAQLPGQTWLQLEERSEEA
jgi:hypothetical protein